MIVKRTSRWWSFVVALILAAQIGLGFHQLEHRLNPDLLAGDECALCQFASAVTEVPPPAVITPPTRVVVDYVVPAAPQLPQRPRFTAGFRSRAPPAVSA